jgi:hypothetical protein
MNPAQKGMKVQECGANLFNFLIPGNSKSSRCAYAHKGISALLSLELNRLDLETNLSLNLIMMVRMHGDIFYSLLHLHAVLINTIHGYI